MTALEAGRPRRAGLLVPVLLTLLGLAVLLGLGTWQLERKAWKQELIARIGERLAAPPIRLPPREAWGRLDRGELEFRRVTFPAEFLHEQEALVYASGSALRSDVAGPGYWVFTPARLPGGSLVLVNRGFVPEGRQDPKGRAQGQVAGVVDVVGAVRWPEERGAFTPADNPAANLWFVRDPAAIAAAKGIGPLPPFYVDQEAPNPPGGLPRAARIEPKLPDNHLQYAVTWYGLAACLAGVFLVWLRQRRRARAA